MGGWFRNILSCCDKGGEEEEERPALQISGPTNFRREDINIGGLDPEQQRWIREKAIADAGRMYQHLSPLRSSPSDQFAEPKTSATLLSYEDFTTPRSAPDPKSPKRDTDIAYSNYSTPGHGATQNGRRPSVSSQALDRVKAHGRRISNTLSKSLGGAVGYQSVGTGNRTSKDGGSPYEMRALMASKSQVVSPFVSPGKMSVDSYSVAGSEEERDGGKMGITF